MRSAFCCISTFYIGGFVTFDIDDTFQFQPELVYSEQGSKAEAGNYEEKFKANYLNIPLVFKAKMFGTEKFKTVFGPQIGIMVKSELSSDSPMGDVDMKEATKDLDVALALGLEYDFDDNFSINARYNWGVTKIFD
ncbi:porin family protein [Marinifilum fragile]|uniref:porin family protein n=1 Tax=Marinifilum fragile TaxID=570161 RepID=UPI002AA61835|nr:porin family protein [Marinifilum fragile]